MRGIVYKLIVVLLLASLISGCTTIAYYSQSVMGHSRLMLARQSIDEVLINAEPKLKQQLELAESLRDFAVTELGLPDNDSYTTYVALERDYPVWTVVAAPEFSLQPKNWCYPIIGCASYRGYFSETEAQEYARSLTRQGFETNVGGATAYSTLGWFSDPILPSMLRNGEARFAEVLFHELAHQQLYIKGDSAFNEAFASVVGEQGALKWLGKKKQPQVLNDYLQQRKAVTDFDQLLNKTKSKLESLYQSELPAEQKRSNKKLIFTELARDYQHLKESRWSGRDWFGHWFSKPVNNARLASISTYREKLPKFERLLADCGFDFSRFYQILEIMNDKNRSVIPQSCVEVD